MSIDTIPIIGYKEGLTTNKKPVLLSDQAWQLLYNARVWRERVLKREGLKFLGRLRRTLTVQPLGNNDGAGHFSGNIRTILTLETNAEISSGTLIISDGTNTFTDQGNGLLVGVPAGTGSINYSTTALIINGGAAGGALTATFSYFPSLPVMGIPLRDLTPINDEQTIWFDQKYAYVWTGTAFVEFIPGTTWNGNDSDFFWAFNYRGAAPQDKLFFVTNFNNGVTPDPIRYTDGVTWTNFAPLVTATQTLYQCRIIVAYYGRLLFLNTWEGTTAGGQAVAVNISNRCRFSQLGSPIDPLAWRTDIFGRGGLLDAPTNEAIIGATFVKNTLIVDFETSTWQLRYVGEYGLPFIWERVSADFGSESTFSGVLFDNHRLVIGDKGITAGNAVGVERIDLQIPDTIFQFKNANNGVKRPFGIRDYKRELVFWNFPDAQTQKADGVDLVFPNRVLVYNYRNSTYAIFRDNVTAFGTFQPSTNITWDNTDIFWDDESITWDDPDSQSKFPIIVCGNQQGFISQYGYVTPDEKTLTVQGLTIAAYPLTITSVNHNLATAEIIYLEGLHFLNAAGTAVVTTNLNNQIYRVRVLTADTFVLSKWNFTTQAYEENFSFTPVTTALYFGGGSISLFPQLSLQTKDFNIYASKGMGTKLSSIDFLMGATTTAAMTVRIFINSSKSVVGNSPTVGGNFTVGQTNVPTYLSPGFYPEASDYAWFKFWATASGQYFSILLYYDDNLMNTFSTHEQAWTLYSINANCRVGGRLVV